ncbi:hypothetical protein RF11_11620 [Thelohanellus kitauei]|uniref:Uncharacterized protein n=1 Tax=Thelohanellus kitauei TaxID=669202 RepID=A0A0C2JKR5_THEKT|nr:hypothetical protein RF11_11620 [Thelohanellus kitauei]
MLQTNSLFFSTTASAMNMFMTSAANRVRFDTSVAVYGETGNELNFIYRLTDQLGLPKCSHGSSGQFIMVESVDSEVGWLIEAVSIVSSYQMSLHNLVNYVKESLFPVPMGNFVQAVEFSRYRYCNFVIIGSHFIHLIQPAIETVSTDRACGSVLLFSSKGYLWISAGSNEVSRKMRRFLHLPFGHISLFESRKAGQMPMKALNCIFRGWLEEVCCPLLNQSSNILSDRQPAMCLFSRTRTHVGSNNRRPSKYVRRKSLLLDCLKPGQNCSADNAKILFLRLALADGEYYHITAINHDYSRRNSLSPGLYSSEFSNNEFLEILASKRFGKLLECLGICMDPASLYDSENFNNAFLEILASKRFGKLLECSGISMDPARSPAPMEEPMTSGLNAEISALIVQEGSDT